MTAARVFEHRRIWRLTSPALVEACRLLAHSAERELGPIACVVGIAHGGTAPAALIAAALGVPAHRVHATHNTSHDTYVQATGTVTVDVTDLRRALRRHGPLAGVVLVVDDICGSGATLAAVTPRLAQLAEPGTRIHTVTLCRNLGAPQPPDFCCWEVADWVVFPWEPPPAGQATTPLPAPTEVITRA